MSHLPRTPTVERALRRGGLDAARHPPGSQPRPARLAVLPTGTLSLVRGLLSPPTLCVITQTVSPGSQVAGKAGFSRSGRVPLGVDSHSGPSRETAGFSGVRNVFGTISGFHLS